MLSLLQQRRTYGCFLPRSKAYNPSRGRAFAKTTVLRLTASKQIDVFGSIPSESSTGENRKIKEIIFAKTIIVVVTDGGLCRAFYLGSGLLALELNPRNPWRKVTTAVYNHTNDTIVVVYEPNPGGLQCRDSVNVLTEELVLSHPAFFEFDEANGMILAAQQGNVRFFQFWNHEKFTPVFSVYEEEFEAVFDIEDGRRLADVEIPLDHYRSVEFLELLVCQLLLKQERLSLRIINLLDGGTGHKVAQTRDTFAPIGFVFFEAPERVYNKKYLNNCHRRFFTISEGKIEFWSLRCDTLDHLHTIRVAGLRDAGLCQQSVQADLLVVFASGDAEPGFLPSLDGFTTGLELQRNYLQSSTPKYEPSQAYREARSFGAAPRKKDLMRSGPKGVHFLSLYDGELLGTVSPELCGYSTEVLQLSGDAQTIACGDAHGAVRLVRIPTPYDTPSTADHEGMLLTSKLNQRISPFFTLPIPPYELQLSLSRRLSPERPSQVVDRLATEHFTTSLQRLSNDNSAESEFQSKRTKRSLGEERPSEPDRNLELKHQKQKVSMEAQ
ncbi:UNVERIFIED_CONTAM: hypothetical protein HHA_240525 [Hammondia hammondi]|eukprot:XP_008887856.1 hypothetical protein HHA_240525 [Hammondia hammondi]